MKIPPAGLFPITQENVHATFDFIFAPWVKEMGFTDFIVREGFCSLRLPLLDKLRFSTGAICGQALMAAIDSAAGIAAATTPQFVKGTVYQHTHFLRPAKNDDFLVEAIVKRFGKASAYIDCTITFVGSGELVAHAVVEYAL